MAEPQKDEGEEKRAVLVSVADRGNGLGGWFAAGRHWPPGSYEAELTTGELAKLVHRPGVVVVDKATGRAITAGNQAPQRVSFTETVTAEERKLLEEHRARRAKEPSKEDKSIPLASLGKSPSAQEAAQVSPAPGSDLSAPPSEPAPSAGSKASDGKPKGK